MEGHKIENIQFGHFLARLASDVERTLVNWGVNQSIMENILADILSMWHNWDMHYLLQKDNRQQILVDLLTIIQKYLQQEDILMSAEYNRAINSIIKNIFRDLYNKIKT